MLIMDNFYKTGVLNHIKSLRYVLLYSSVIPLCFYFIVFIEKSAINLGGLMLLATPVLLFVGPAIYLHISYYLENFRLKVIIDERQNTLILNKSGKEQAYHFSNLISVEQHLAIYYKNRIDHVSRREAPWTPYGYLLLKFNDGLEVYVTSLMLDVVHPPIIPTHTYFRYFPYMKAGIEFSKRRVAVIEYYENEISQYKSNFKNHTDQQLNEKLINWKTYDKAAVEAARQLLAIRTSIV